MTCIVGLVEDGKVWMGGDSSAIAGEHVWGVEHPKVWAKNDYLFGYAGSFRLGQVVEHAFVPPARAENESLMYYMTIKFINELREVLAEHGCLVTSGEGIEGLDESLIMVGYEGHVFVIDDDLQVNECNDGYVAIGCGGDYALGSLYSTKGKHPHKRVLKALKAAAHFTKGVRPPYTIGFTDVVTQ